VTLRFTCPHCGDDFAGFSHGHEYDDLTSTAGDQCPMCVEAMDNRPEEQMGSYDVLVQNRATEAWGKRDP